MGEHIKEKDSLHTEWCPACNYSSTLIKFDASMYPVGKEDNYSITRYRCLNCNALLDKELHEVLLGGG